MTTPDGSQTSQPAGPEVPEQAGKILSQFAGYVGFKTIEMGLNNGLFEALRQHPDGLTADELAGEAGTDEFYTGVWSQAASGARRRTVPGSSNWPERTNTFLPPHMDKLLLDTDFPG